MKAEKIRKKTKGTMKSIKQQIEIQLGKLQVKPGDIVLVTVPKGLSSGGRERVQNELRRLLPPNQKVILRSEGLAIEELSKALSPDDLNRVQAAWERRAVAGGTGPMQTETAERVAWSTKTKTP
jgi:hypothetical protein